MFKKTGSPPAILGNQIKDSFKPEKPEGKTATPSKERLRLVPKEKPLRGETKVGFYVDETGFTNK